MKDQNTKSIKKETQKTTREALALYMAIVHRAHEEEQMKEKPDVEQLVILDNLKKKVFHAVMMLIPNWRELQEHPAPVSATYLDELGRLLKKDKEGARDDDQN